MVEAQKSLQKGKIYVVATPIGNLADLSPRAQTILAEVDCIAAEDTRLSRRLLNHFDINTPCTAYHEHNESEKTQQLLSWIAEGKNLALIADAGTPLISDPGFRLIHGARKQGITVIPIPGPCAAIVALSAAGLPSDRFVFEGFLPAKSTARLKRLQQLSSEKRTMIFYESCHRINVTLADMLTVFGGKREMVLARELTKRYETIYGGTLADGLQWIKEDAYRQKGEFVVCVHGDTKDRAEDKQSVSSDILLSRLLGELPLKKAVNITVEVMGLRKNEIYQRALQLSGNKES